MQDITKDKIIERHNREVASTMKILTIMDNFIKHDEKTCNTGEFCQIDAMKALLAGKATVIQQEMAAASLANDLLSITPEMPLILAILGRAMNINKETEQ